MVRTKTLRNLAFLGLVLAFAMRSSVGIRADPSCDSGWCECLGEYSAHYWVTSPLTCPPQEQMDSYCDDACMYCTDNQYMHNAASYCVGTSDWYCSCGS